MAQGCQIALHVLDLEAATHPTIATMCDYWCTLNNGLPPSRKAFAFMSIYKVAPHLLVAERIAPHTFKFIYCGTHVADNLPHDLTGFVYGPDTPRASSVNWPALCDDIVDGPCVRYDRLRIDWRNDDYGEILYGACPMCDADGQSAYVVGCLVFIRRSPYAVQAPPV